MIEIKNVKLMQCDTVNKNGRVYPKEVVEKALQAYKEMHGDAMLGGLGEIENPEPSIRLQDVSHRIDNIHFDENCMCGDITILNTPRGNAVENILKSGITLHCNSFSVGDVNENGVVEEYDLNCINLVDDGGFENCGIKYEKL